MEVAANKELIFIEQEFRDRQEAIGFLADKLFENDYVKEGFKSSILKREEEYPTGLKGQYCGFALSHTECEMVKRPGFAVAILKNKVEFERMGDEGTVDVDIIFMLALDTHDGHLMFLQKLAELMQSKEFVDDLLSSADKTHAFALLKDKF